jgi:hypothetical protein
MTWLAHLPLVGFFLERLSPHVWYITYFCWLGLGLAGVKKKQSTTNRRRNH